MPGQVTRATAAAISAAGEPSSNGGGSVRRSKAASAGEVKVSQVQTTKATSNEIAMRIDNRVGGRRTITASSWQQRPTVVSVWRGFCALMVRLARGLMSKCSVPIQTGDAGLSAPPGGGG